MSATVNAVIIIPNLLIFCSVYAPKVAQLVVGEHLRMEYLCILLKEQIGVEWRFFENGAYQRVCVVDVALAEGFKPVVVRVESEETVEG